MINKTMMQLGQQKSAIRALYELGLAHKRETGLDNLVDLSIGNPCVPPPSTVTDRLVQLAQTPGIHDYTSAPGDITVRTKLAAYIANEYKLPVSAADLYMTCGAAAALSIVFNALCCAGDEFVILAPYFPEYAVFVRAAGGREVIVPMQDDCGIDWAALDHALTPHTKAVIVNSPNNPSGVVYDRATLQRLADVLTEKQRQWRQPIYIVADEPYRQVVYDGKEVPYIPCVYDNTVVCYSYSKSLSLPGERIGYIHVPQSVCDHDNLYDAICGAGRALGYVCAGSLFQHLVADMPGLTANMSLYEDNRRDLCDGLARLGYHFVYPHGAFYLLIQSPVGSGAEFSRLALQYGLLLVDAATFGAPNHVRLAYCVPHERVQEALRLLSVMAQDLHLQPQA